MTCVDSWTTTMTNFQCILKSRRNKWNELIGRYAEIDEPTEDMYFTSLPEGENYNCYINKLCRQDNEANLSASQSKGSSKVQYVHRKRNSDTDVIPKNVRQNRKCMVRKSGFKIENYDKFGKKIIKLDTTKTHNFGFAKANAVPKVKIKSTIRRSNCKIPTNVHKPVFNIENIDKNAISKKFIKLDTMKTHNFGVLSKINPKEKVKEKSKNSRSNCSKDLSNFKDAKDITFRSVINNEHKTIINNLNILYEPSNKVDRLPAFLNKSTSSICHINALSICQDNSLLPVERFATNTDEKLITFRKPDQDTASAWHQRNTNNIISNLHNTTFLKNTTIISKSVNNFILLDSSESEEENCIPEINSHILPQRAIDKIVTNLKKDEISSNSFRACKPACSSVVSAKSQNKCETNSDSDYDVWDDIFPTSKSRIGILM